MPNQPQDHTPELLALARGLVERSTPGEELEVVLARSGSMTVKAYGASVESLSSAESFGVGIRVISNHQVGFAHAGSFDPQVLDETLAAARENATFAEPDDANVLARPDGVQAVPQPQAFSDAMFEMSTDDKVAMALDLEARTLARDPRVTSVRTATYGESWGESVLVSTTGMAVGGRSSHCSVGVQPLASADGDTQIGYGYDVGRDPRLLDIDHAASEAVERSTRLLGARQAKTARLPIVLEPRLAATLMGIVGGLCNGEALIKGRTPFAGRVGELVASPLVHLIDDPTDPESYGAEEYDGEGLACRVNELVVDGVLRQFLHNTFTAAKASAVSTASAVRGARSLPGVGAMALRLRPGSGDLDDLCRQVGDGLLVNSFAGLHSGVNPISGDFSVGADGLVIRGGAIAEPVREITLASTLQRMLADVIAVGDDVERLPSGASMPSIVIADMTLSGA